jgi:hypothetical protein
VRLARPSRNDAIHETVEGSSIESHSIAEDFGLGEAEPEPARDFRFAFDGGDAAVFGEGKLDGNVEAADARAERQSIHVTTWSGASPRS